MPQDSLPQEPVTLSLDRYGVIRLAQSDDTHIILMSRKQALALAYRLMSLAQSQGPSIPEIIGE